jgi:uncharacterized phage protein (TIGR01671 family)
MFNNKELKRQVKRLEESNELLCLGLLGVGHPYYFHSKLIRHNDTKEGKVELTGYNNLNNLIDFLNETIERIEKLEKYLGIELCKEPAREVYKKVETPELNKKKENKMTNDRLKFRTPVYKDKKVWKFYYWDAGKKVVPALTKRLSFKEDEQCTGLKDKNGKLIYEGDILYIYDGRKTITCQHRKSVVSYSKDVGAYYADNNLLGDYLFDYKAEIIGNIHENPELMEVR